DRMGRTASGEILYWPPRAVRRSPRSRTLRQLITANDLHDCLSYPKQHLLVNRRRDANNQRFVGRKQFAWPNEAHSLEITLNECITVQLNRTGIATDCW